jgi:uncharacterized protein (TIGR00296 family)
MDTKEGQSALSIARRAIELYVKEHKKLNPDGKDVPKLFSEKSGVFVTLFTYPEKELRGCIGYPEPVQSLIDALIDSAINAATQDPRFEPLREDELDRIVIHVSILTIPEPVHADDPKDYPKIIELGKDGLIVELGYNRGLLLPEVATEHDMGKEEFLSQTCLKAGLSPDAWRHEHGLRIYKFQSHVFSEKEPGKPDSVTSKETK